MTNKSSIDTEREIADFIAQQLKKLMSDHNINSSILSENSGLSKATISNILSAQLGLPSLRSIYRLAVFFKTDVDYFLLKTNGITSMRNITMDFYPDAFLSENKMYEEAAISNPEIFRVYICDTIPEFLKTEAILRAEIGGRKEIQEYAARMEGLKNFLLSSTLSGLYLCDRYVLDSLKKRQGCYAALSTEEMQDQVEKIMKFNSAFFPQSQGYAVDYRKTGLTTCYLYDRDQIVMFSFEGYLSFFNQPITQTVKERVRNAISQGEGIQAYLER